MQRRRIVVLAVGACLVASCSSSPDAGAPTSPSTATAGSTGVETPTGTGASEPVTAEGMVEHLEALEAIAERNDGTRVAGSPGYDASVAYVSGVLRDAGYEVETMSTAVPFYEIEGPTVLERISPDPESWTDGVNFRSMLFSPSGDVQARVTPAGTGCEFSEFAGFPAGDIALVVPGPCFRRQQATNAQDAGAAAMIGVTLVADGRPLRPTLVYPEDLEIPLVAVTADLADELDGGPTVRIRVEASSSYRPAESVIAELPAASDDDVVMLGAHLDSVVDGPGINDNGSGSALLLETARWLAGLDPAPPVRFAFWAGEEEGLYGSWDYAHDLAPEEREAIDVYLNLDMVGSSNHVSFVYEAPPNAPRIEQWVAELFTEALADAGHESEPLDLHGASDHAAFQDVGIETGGLYSGSQEQMTRAQSRDYDGDAGEPLDPCYHQPCDTVDNVDPEALEIHAAALVEVLTALLLA
jgi:Zn-dependent M28 family amino/carboxypeptidase